MDTQRTRPGFLSEGETETDRRRTEEMVRDFLRWKHITNIGETSNFVVDYDCNKRLVILYGKEIPSECRFKLAFDEIEMTAVINLLKQARTFFKSKDSRIGN